MIRDFIRGAIGGTTWTEDPEDDEREVVVTLPGFDPGHFKAVLKVAREQAEDVDRMVARRCPPTGRKNGWR